MEALVPIWITSGFTAIGVMYAIIRNGNRGKKQDDTLKAELKLEIDHVKKRLEDPETGLSAIKKSLDAQALHCIKVSTGLASQVSTNAKEIDTLRKKKR